MKFEEVKVQVTILTNFQKKGCWILKKSHLSLKFTMKFEEVKVQVTILTNFQKKGCWILKKSHLSSDENKPYY